MEVRKQKVSSLCNVEVLSLLNEIKQNNQFPGNNFATVLYESTKYLSQLNGHTEEQVGNLLTALLEFPVPLTHNEKLMIVNTPPTTPLQLSLILHNCDDRLNEERTEQLLDLVRTHLSLPTS